MSIKLITAWVFCSLVLLISSAISAPIADSSTTEQTSPGANNDDDSGEEGEDAIED